MSDDETPADYNNIHRAFLQCLLSRGTITFTSAQPILAAIQTAQTPNRPTLPGDITIDDFTDIIDTISSSISPFDYEIRSSLHQQSKERIWALVNTTSDPITQMSTTLTADEVAFVRRVLDAMFETYNTPEGEVMAVTGMQALKLAKAPATDRRDSTQQTQSQNLGLTMHQAETVLSRLVAQNWLSHSDAGFYSLSQRGIMELRTWLSDTYNDPDDEETPHIKIKTCHACRDIVTIGQRCPNLTCNTRLHDHCVRNAFRAQSGSEKCPSCKTDWVEAPPVGEKASRAGARNGPGGRRSGGGGRRRSSVRSEESDD